VPWHCADFFSSAPSVEHLLLSTFLFGLLLLLVAQEQERWQKAQEIGLCSCVAHVQAAVIPQFRAFRECNGCFATVATLLAEGRLRMVLDQGGTELCVKKVGNFHSLPHPPPLLLTLYCHL